jgi:endoglucanase
VEGRRKVKESTWIQDWLTLARRYVNEPHVIGADLHNEPHGAATWGSENSLTDWRMAATRCGNEILKVNPNWLIVVEGVQMFDNTNYW